MASQSAYINVLKGPTGPVNTTISFVAKNNPTALSLTVPIEFAGAMDEITAAEYIRDQLNSAFATANVYYGDFPTGQPQFEQTAGYYQVLLRAFVVDHVVNIWSQAQFTMKVSAPVDGSGSNPPIAANLAVIVGSVGPAYLTLDDFKRYCKLFQVGADFNLDQLDIIQLIRAGSDELRGLLGFEPIGTQYLQEVRGNNTTGFNMDRYPILVWDDPCFNGPLYYNIGHNLTSLKAIYDVDCAIGAVSFGTVQLPLDYDIIVKMSYAAGLPTIDSIIKQAVMRLMRLLLNPGDFTEMRGGSGTVKRRDPAAIRKEIRQTVEGLFV
jgi:hypothetical protein